MNNGERIEGVISKETAKAYYLAICHYAEGGAHEFEPCWIPKSQMSDVRTGEAFDNYRNNRVVETRREFSATVPAWLASKIMPPRRGPIPMAQRPW